MSNIEILEQKCMEAQMSVDAQKNMVANASGNLGQARERYLQSVVGAALLKERTKRKVDLFANLLLFGGLAVIAIIAFCINPVVGVLFVVGAVVIGIVIYNKNSEENGVNYAGRKRFFEKYAQFIPNHERLQWRGETSNSGGYSTTEGWVCPRCNTTNSADSNFCIGCGNSKI
jgi:hypothetical protein